MPVDRQTREGESEPSSGRRSGFRDDIQGMRALAVLGIMLFHAGYSPYPGGFVTLDVFFVVSGFLITYLLLREVERDGTVSLLKFYSRRARRILPAATVVTIATVGASALWLNVVDAREAAFDALWSSLFGANIRFALQETDYFAREDAPSPMQHYWSLSVEEQFYLVLPVVLVVCCLLARRRGRRAGAAPGRAQSRHLIGYALGGLTALSFGWSVYASSASPDTAYFSTFTRTWEFGVGALFALAAPRFGALSNRSRNLLGFGGVGAIVLACFVVTAQTPFPGWMALLPVLGTGAVMAAGAGVRGRPPLAQRMLGVAPLRWVGDASYSLYLWHWPLLTIATQHLRRDLTAGETFAVVALTFLLSWASLTWVETPLRRWTPRRLPRTLVLYPVSVVMVVAGHLSATTWIEAQAGGDGPPIAASDYTVGPGGEALDPDPLVALVQVSTRAAREGRELPSELQPPLVSLRESEADLGDCDYARKPPWKLCRRGDPDADRVIVLLGNSHGRHWIPALERISRRSGYAAYYFVKEACTPVRVVSVERSSDDPWEECSEFNSWAEDQVRQLDPALVLVAGSAPRAIVADGGAVYDTDRKVDLMRDGFADLFDDIAPLADRVAVLADVPRRQIEPADCLGRREATLADCLDTPKPSATRIVEASRQAARDRGVQFVDTARWFCADGQCPAVVGTYITMRDQGHVTTAYSERLAEPLGRAVDLWGSR